MSLVSKLFQWLLLIVEPYGWEMMCQMTKLDHFEYEVHEFLGFPNCALECWPTASFFLWWNTFISFIVGLLSEKITSEKILIKTVSCCDFGGVPLWNLAQMFRISAWFPDIDFEEEQQQQFKQFTDPRPNKECLDLDTLIVTNRSSAGNHAVARHKLLQGSLQNKSYGQNWSQFFVLRDIWGMHLTLLHHRMR